MYVFVHVLSCGLIRFSETLDLKHIIIISVIISTDRLERFAHELPADIPLVPLHK